MGRAANYLYPASTGEESVAPSPKDLSAVLEFILEGKELPGVAALRVEA